MSNHVILSRRTRSIVAALVAALLATAAALLPTSPAQALPSGTGWSASWSYYATNAFQYQATLPGVRLTGYASDNSGTRSTVGTIEDTAADGRCARVLLYASGVGYVADRTTCGSGTYQTYSTGTFYDQLLIIVYRTIEGTTTSDKSLYTFVPSSASDSGLRTVGTGTSWSYYTSTAFQYAVTRTGVQVYGYGAHQSFDRRSSLNSIGNTGSSSSGCATGRSRDYNSTITGSACGVGSGDTYSATDFTGWIEAEGCYRSSPTATNRCLTVHVPEPY